MSKKELTAMLERSDTTCHIAEEFSIDNNLDEIRDVNGDESVRDAIICAGLAIQRAIAILKGER